MSYGWLAIRNALWDGVRIGTHPIDMTGCWIYLFADGYSCEVLKAKACVKKFAFVYTLAASNIKISLLTIGKHSVSMYTNL